MCGNCDYDSVVSYFRRWEIAFQKRSTHLLCLKMRNEQYVGVHISHPLDSNKTRVFIKNEDSTTTAGKLDTGLAFAMLNDDVWSDILKFIGPSSAPAAPAGGYSFGFSSFGATSPAALAPAAGEFSFGGAAAPAPAATPAAGGFIFGGTSAAPAARGFSFGGSIVAAASASPAFTTPAAGEFFLGSTAAPAPSTAPAAEGFSFGGGGVAATPAAGRYSFGDASAAALAAAPAAYSFSFSGATVAGAPAAGGFSFGGAAPALFLPSFGTPAPAAAGGLDAGVGNASKNKRLAKSKGKK